MKINSLLHGMRPDFEDRKRALQRRDAGEAYKKHAQYADPKKSPMLQALENLLSGKTEKELLAADNTVNNSVQQATSDENLEHPTVKKEIEQLKQTEKEVIAHEQAHKAVGGNITGPIVYSHTTGPDDEQYIVAGEVSINAPTGDTPDETIALLEKVRQAALAPAEPSPQDLRVAASAAAQIQQVRGEEIVEEAEQTEEQEPFAGASLQVNIPEQFQSDFNRDPEKETVFGKDLEQLLFQRNFAKATQKYAAHYAMVQNGYRSMYEPSFVQSA